MGSTGQFKSCRCSQGRVFELIKPFRSASSIWPVRLEASRALLDLELQYSGLDAALQLFTKYLEEEPSLKGQILDAYRLTF